MIYIVPKKIYSHFLQRRSKMKSSVLVLCLGLTLGVALVDSARSCRDEEQRVFHMDGSLVNCAVLVGTYPHYCLEDVIKNECCNQCTVAEAKGEVTCEDKAECANMPTSGCESEMVGPEMEMEMEMGGPEGPGATGGPAGDPQMMNVCPKKCGMC